MNLCQFCQGIISGTGWIPYNANWCKCEGIYKLSHREAIERMLILEAENARLKITVNTLRTDISSSECF